MKATQLLEGSWERDGTEHKLAFDVDEYFSLKSVYLDFDGLATDAKVALNGAEVGSRGDVKADRFKVTGAIRLGPNELVVRTESEQPCTSARLISYDRVSVAGLAIEPEIVDNTANVWISIDVANHTCEEQKVLASVVVAQGESREKMEIAEVITPFGGVIEAVVRIEDVGMWKSAESDELPVFDCLVGLEIAGEVVDVAAVMFDID